MAINMSSGKVSPANLHLWPWNALQPTDFGDSAEGADNSSDVIGEGSLKSCVHVMFEKDIVSLANMVTTNLKQT